MKLKKQTSKFSLYKKNISYVSILMSCLVLLLSTPVMASGFSGQCGSAQGKEYNAAPSKKSEMCTNGLVSDIKPAGSGWSWVCAGSGDGGSPLCTAENCGTPIVIAGVCDNATRNECSRGVPNDGAIADTGTEYRWRCDGENGGANSGTCSSPIPASPIAGVCNNATRNACNAGTPNDGAIADTGTEYRWRCDGENGGANSGQCQKTIPVTPVNCGVAATNVGSYNGKTYGSLGELEPDACTGGGKIYKGTHGFCSKLSGTSFNYNSRPSYTCVTASNEYGADCTAAAYSGECSFLSDADPTSCGPAAGNSYTDAAAVNAAGSLCDGIRTGAYDGSNNRITNVTGSGSWNWTCRKETGVNFAYAEGIACSANKLPACNSATTGSNTNGTCGSAHGDTFASSAAVTSAERCAVGSVTGYSSTATSASWTCSGAGTGTNQSCSATITAGTCTMGHPMIWYGPGAMGCVEYASPPRAIEYTIHAPGELIDAFAGYCTNAPSGCNGTAQYRCKADGSGIIETVSEFCTDGLPF